MVLAIAGFGGVEGSGLVGIRGDMEPWFSSE